MKINVRLSATISIAALFAFPAIAKDTSPQSYWGEFHETNSQAFAGNLGGQSANYQQLRGAYELVRSGKDTKALSLLQQLEAKQFQPAYTLLGSLYATGRGVGRDDARATGYYALAAEAGDPQAMYLYGYALDNEIGVARDRDAAQVWMQRASDSGVAAVQKAVRAYRERG